MMHCVLQGLKQISHILPYFEQYINQSLYTMAAAKKQDYVIGMYDTPPNKGRTNKQAITGIS